MNEYKMDNHGLRVHNLTRGINELKWLLNKKKIIIIRINESPKKLSQ